MDYVAAILLFGAAAVGLVPFTHISKDGTAQRMPILLHAALAVLGYLSLVIYAVVTEKEDKHIELLIILGIAGLIGLWVWLGKTSPLGKKGWLMVYSLVGLFGLWWLLTFLIKY